MVSKCSRIVVIGSASALVMAAGNASAFDMQVGATAVNLYGYAKLDFIYDIDADLGASVGHGNIEIDGENVGEGFTRLQALESRLGLRTATPTARGDFVTVIEGDFFGANNTFRLRQGYGTWGDFLAGQTWSNFSTFVGFTPTLDFTGQPGQTVINRQGQIRYTVAGLSVALESPRNLGGELLSLEDDAGTAVTENVQQGQLPDFTLRYELTEGPFAFAASGLLRQIGFDTGTSSDSEIGYAINLAAGFEAFPGITVRGGVLYGDGVGGYMYVAPGPAGFVDANGNVETVEQIGGTLGVSAELGAGTLNIAYGIAYADWDDAENAFAADPVLAAAVAGSNERFQSLFVNYIWSPVANMRYGIEAGYHTRRVVDGRDGSAVRLQASAIYEF